MFFLDGRRHPRALLRDRGRPPRLALFALIACLVSPGFGAADAAAASSGAAPTAEEESTAAGFPPGEVDALVEELKDPARRAALLERLELLGSASERGAGAAQGARPDASGAADATGAAPSSAGPAGIVEASETLVANLVEEVTAVDPVGFLRGLGLTVALILGAFVARHLVRRLLARLAGRFVGWMRRSDGIDFGREALRDSPDQLFEGLPYTLVDVALTLVAVVLVLDLWNLSLVDWLRSLAGGELARRGLTMLVVGLVTTVVWVVSDAVIEGWFRLRSRSLRDPRGRLRMHTVVPLVRGLTRFLIGGTGLLMMLAALGVDVTPLLASAGVVGLAIGFGAQSLIKDLLVGAFLVLEDACGVDDWVEIGDHAGTVENMGLRTMRLRDLSGTVHYLPYSEVGTVRNYTKEFAYAWLDVPVDYEIDLDRVFGIVEEVGEEIARDPDFRGVVLESPHLFGVNDFGERGPVVTVRMKTVAVERWSVGREYRRRLKRRFDAEGIAIPFPRTRIAVDSNDAPAPFGRTDAEAFTDPERTPLAANE